MKTNHALLFLSLFLAGHSALAAVEAPATLDRSVTEPQRSRFSATLSAGLNGSFWGRPPSYSAPFSVELTGSFWPTEWLVLDTTAAWAGDIGRFLLVAGPRLRTPWWKLHLSAGARVGVFVDSVLPYVSSFGVMPVVAIEATVTQHLQLAVQANLNLPLFRDATMAPDMSLSLSTTWRF